MDKRSSNTEKRAFWEYAIAEQANSSLSVRRFCQREGLSEPAFYQWRKRLSLPDGKSAATSSSASVSSVSSGPRFTPVTVVDDVAASPSLNAHALSPDHPGDHPIEVVLCGGRLIRLRGVFDRQVFLEAVGALESLSC